MDSFDTLDFSENVYSINNHAMHRKYKQSVLPIRI